MSTVKAEVVYYEGAEIKERSGGVPAEAYKYLIKTTELRFSL